MAPPNFPQLILEGGFTPGAPDQAGAFILDDAVFGVLDTGTLGESTTWTDLSQWVRSGSVNRAGNRQAGPLWSYQAGTASVTLNNKDGRFDPDNLSGPYTGGGATELNAMVPVRLRAVWQGTPYPLFSGFADSWGDAGGNFAGRYAETTLSATDGQKVLAGVQLPGGGSAGAGETTGARVMRILDAAAWYTGTGQRDVDAGLSAVQAYAGGDSAWNLLQQAADAEIGELYLNGSGQVVFRNRHAILTDARSSTPQATFGDLVIPGGLNGFPLGDDANFSGGTLGSWEANTNCTVAVSGAQSHSGANSMAMTATAPAAMSADDGTNTIACPPGATVVVSAWFRAAATGRGMRVGVQFFDSLGAFISTVKSSAVTDSTSGWTLASTQITAPANAALVHLYTSTDFAAAAEVHYADDFSLFFPELPYYSVSRARDDTTLANDIQATIAGGGNLQEAQDAASVAKYLFPRSYARSDLILTSDPDALNWAQWVLYVARSDEDRFDQLVIYPLRDPANLWPQALGREVGDRIRIWRRPPGVASPVTKDCFIRGIAHQWDVSANTWSTTFTLQSADKYGSFMTLDNPVTGKLDSDALAY